MTDSPRVPALEHSPSTDRGRGSTADSTPIATPVTAVATHFGGAARPRKKQGLAFSWHQKPAAASNTAFLDDTDLFDEAEHDTFPLFPPDDMDGGAVPIDIAPRLNSRSPRNHTSNLTFALQEAGALGDYSSAISVGARNGSDGRLSVTGRQDSVSNGLPSSYLGSGARQIPGRTERPRRESGAGSFANGMSWGGVSVGSWVRDDILMTGTSPYAFHQSPSFHSSSYLPKMEANFLRDYTCCGIMLDSLHELLQHYEENHAQPSKQILQRSSQIAQPGASGRAAPSTATGAGAQSAQHFGVGQQQRQNHTPQQQSQVAPTPPLQDVDTLDDMEMDDTPATPMQANFGSQQQRAFGQTVPHVPPLKMNLGNTMQSHSGLRSATPTTPAAGATFTYPHNPTVSSVNTPAFNTPVSATASQNTQKSPDSSVPGTPHAEFDMSNLDLTSLPMGSDMMQMQMANPNFDWTSLGNNTGFPGATSNFGTGLQNDMSGLTIDEPAKRLYSKQGGGLTQQQLQYALRTGQLGSDTEVARAVQQQLAGQLGVGGGSAGIDIENKPFRCPVIGCEKAYKNQNGLKYHKTHGHQNQQLRENEDGSFSIVDPVTSIPYPGTVGMEKEKPYRCDVCGKRYKNLNGLKYHKQHSPPCNPDLKLNMPNLAGLNVGLGAGDANGVNVAGAGLAVGLDGMDVGGGAERRMF